LGVLLGLRCTSDPEGGCNGFGCFPPPPAQAAHGAPEAHRRRVIVSVVC